MWVLGISHCYSNPSNNNFPDVVHISCYDRLNILPKLVLLKKTRAILALEQFLVHIRKSVC